MKKRLQVKMVNTDGGRTVTAQHFMNTVKMLIFINAESLIFGTDQLYHKESFYK